MSWFHFQPGLFNLWLAVLFMNLLPVVVVRLLPNPNPAALKRALRLPPMTTPQRVAYLAVMAPFFLMFPYALLVPFSDNTALLLAGLALWLPAVLFRTRSMVDYALTPPGDLITRGVYRLSRHPGYFSATVAMLGLGLMGGSWLIVCAALWFALGYQWVARLEERMCLEHWPDAYRAYMAAVPRNFVVF